MKFDSKAGEGCPSLRFRRKSGLTLVELMIALGVMMVAVVGSLSAQISSDRLVRTGQETVTAMMDLEACMEQLLLEPFETLPRAGSPFEADQRVAAYQGLHLSNEQIVVTYPGFNGVGVVPDPLEINLTMTWRDFQGRQRTLSLATARTR